MADWAAERGVEPRRIHPGKPGQNAYVESFDSRLRDECVSQHGFASLGHMRSVIGAWREDYNRNRPHSALRYVPPAVHAARCRLRAGGSAEEPSTPIQPPDSGSDGY